MLKKISLMTSRVWPRSPADILVMVPVIRIFVMVVPIETGHRGGAGLLHHGFQRHVVRGGDFAAILIFGRRRHRAVALGKFHLDAAPSRINFANLAAKLQARYWMKPHPDGRGLREEHLRERVAPGSFGEHRD